MYIQLRERRGSKRHHPIRISFIKDLIKEKEERFAKNKSFKSYRELFKPIRIEILEAYGRNVDHNEIAKTIVTTFLDVLISDLIENNNEYVFPVKGFGSLLIRNEELNNYRYDIKTDGNYYVLGFKRGGYYIQNTNMPYKVFLSKRYYDILINKVHNGHRY